MVMAHTNLTREQRAARLGIDVEDFGELRELSLNWGKPPARRSRTPARRRQTSPRLHIQPGDIPAPAAAQRMGMTQEAFAMALPNLVARGFPKSDPDTGNFDLDAIDAWRRSRHAHLFAGRAEFGARDASTVAQDRIAAASRGGR